jgi:hypothetical protein
MATRKAKPATRKRKGPTWAHKKKQIHDALKKIAAASAALKAAQKELAKVLSAPPGGGPDVKN